MKLLKLLMLAFCVGILASCSTVEKFTVEGVPGTKIYSPQKMELATIDSKGKAKIEVPSNAFYGYLYTHNDALDLWVPFGLDIKKKSHSGAHLAMCAEYTGSVIGLAATVVGTVVLIGDEESSVGSAAIAGGLALAGISAGSGLVTSSRMGQLSYQYSFTYQKTQSTNANLALKNYTIPVAAPTESALSRLRTGNSSGSQSQSIVQTQRSQQTQQPHRSKVQLRTKAEKVEGEYGGNATLSQGRTTVETFDAVTVIITAIDEDNVTVDVLSGNDSFFDEPLSFKVRNTATNSYTLTCRNQPNAVITIEDDYLSFTHPAINLGGNSYKLIVEAGK